MQSVVDYENTLNNWKGKSINELLEDWGPASEIHNMSNENKMYTWNYIGNTYISSNYNENINQTNTTSSSRYCETTFTINSSEEILSWTYHGNACNIHILPKSDK